MSMIISRASLGLATPLENPARPAQPASTGAPVLAQPAPAPADTVQLSTPRDEEDATALLEQVRGLLSGGAGDALGHTFDPERLAKLLG